MGLKLVFILTLIAFLVLVRVHVQALNVGIQSNSDIASKKQQGCSRTCESDHCSAPPFLRYGKYCGIMYSGCPGEKPCDGLDACCMVHDACIQAKHNDYLSTECNSNLLNCIAAFRDSDDPTFKDNKCMVQEVADVITVVIEAAILAGRALHKP